MFFGPSVVAAAVFALVLVSEGMTGSRVSSHSQLHYMMHMLAEILYWTGCYWPAASWRPRRFETSSAT